jgi:hypothetical protein
MIMKKNQFNEDTKTKTKDKVDFDFDSLDDLLADPKPANITKPEQPKTASNTPAAGNKKKVSSTVATGAETRTRMKNVKPSADATNTLRGMEMNLDGLEDEIGDDEAAANAGIRTGNTDQTNPEDLPAIMQKAVAKTSTGKDLKTTGEDSHVVWHQVKNLPGYLSGPIRAMGRQIFSPFTSTKIEDIQVVANIGGGPNSAQEMKLTSNLLQTLGHRDSEMEIAFHERIRGYKADVQIWKAMGFTFMVVKDFMGQYIYSWPSSDDKELSMSGNKALPAPRR